MKVNKKPIDFRIDTSERLAGGYGVFTAKQNAEALLRRSVMANLLWEDLFYEDGISNTENIINLIPQVDPIVVADIAIEARTRQKMRHVPLFIAREMAKLKTHKYLVGNLLPKIIKRADELTEFLAIYWKDGKQPISNQVKKGLAKAFNNFDAYQLQKYNRKEVIKLKDVMFIVHPKPLTQEKEETFKQLADDCLPTPDTWETNLSSGKDKKDTWERLINEKKLGALAFLRNLSNMEKVGVDEKVVLKGFATINPQWLLPLNHLAAAVAEPKWEREIEKLMLNSFATMQKLPGYSIFVIDVSGSMRDSISNKSKFTRLDAGISMAILASGLCERVAIYATAGNDTNRKHATQLLKPRQGFALMEEIKNATVSLGGGGIFTRQCLEFVKQNERSVPDRIIIFSDSQDCDAPNSRIPSPFGSTNYIIDVSAHKYGINYKGIWTAEISGWSEHFLTLIAALEGLELNKVE